MKDRDAVSKVPGNLLIYGLSRYERRLVRREYESAISCQSVEEFERARRLHKVEEEFTDDRE